MAIKIIGKDEKYIKRSSCRLCATKFEYTLKDTTTHVHHDYGGGSDSYRWITCPGCHEDINLGMA